MSSINDSHDITDKIRRNPVSTAKILFIALAILLGFTGFFRLVDLGVFINDPLLGDSQFLSLLFIPIVGIALILVVTAETIISAAKIVMSDRSIGEQIKERKGYLAVRATETGFALIGLLLMLSIIPVIFIENTPAPIGVGAMLALFVVGMALLFISLTRSIAELVIYTD